MLPFISPMLCERLADPARLADRRYIAEPKLDGQRTQLHIQQAPGMVWLREIAWPFESAIFDGEACAGDGLAGIRSVFVERNRVGGDMAIAPFDLLHHEGKSVLREPWRDRRKRLEDLLEGAVLPRVGLVPVTQDAPVLYETWIGMGGEGIVLKDPAFLYRPAERSRARLKLKPKLTLDVTVTGGSGERIAWGDWGEAMMLELEYTHPRTGKRTQIRQASTSGRVRWSTIGICPRDSHSCSRPRTLPHQTRFRAA